MNLKTQKKKYLNIKQKKKRITGTAQRPRLCVTKSHKHIYAQIVDDTKKHTLSSCSTLTPQIRLMLKSTATCNAAKIVGEKIAEQSLKLGIQNVVFDRRNKLYHGRIKTLADAARNAGLLF